MAELEPITVKVDVEEVLKDSDLWTELQKAIDQQNKIEILEKRLLDLEIQNETLEQRVSSLETLMNHVFEQMKDEN